MLYGISPVAQALVHQKRSLRRLWVKQGLDSPRVREIRNLARKAGVEVESTDARDLARRVGHGGHQGVALECGELPVLDLPDLLAQDPAQRGLILALDQIEDPQNLGGLIRTAAFLGADAVLTLRGHASPLSPAASKASAGAMEYFPVVVAGNLAQALSELRDQGYGICGSAWGDGSQDYREAGYPDPLVLVLGNEGSGLRSLTRKRCDFLVRIDGDPRTESLNVTVAAGVLLAQLGRTGKGTPSP